MQLQAFTQSVVSLLAFYLVSIPFSPSLGSNSTPGSSSFCGKIRIQPPFSLQNSVNSSSPPLSRSLLCKSQTVYFRTSLGLFPVVSIDYRDKTLSLSHKPCASSLQFVSPTLLSAGFPSPPQPNSLLLFNCSTSGGPSSSSQKKCPSAFGCSAPLSGTRDRPSSCLLIDDCEELEMGFHPRDLNCSHYSRVYRSSSSSAPGGFQLGTRISFGIPDHVPNPCDECSKPNGNCGVGLRCICHPHECRDKVLSAGANLKPVSSLLPLSLLIILIGF
ncbi:hypothetical protein H6P81_003550 [Aristolochia fimbriata]|uniref:Uncharacterized protein n=1 Tax=Aristolochia fimbriata TaxID=158543 RepID=A0AAV7FG68_ARIFI|nr:hypothetical protein H6P81_003550 [Aristolochia fimbriata]